MINKIKNTKKEEAKKKKEELIKEVIEVKSDKVLEEINKKIKESVDICEINKLELIKIKEILEDIKEESKEKDKEIKKLIEKVEKYKGMVN